MRELNYESFAETLEEKQAYQRPLNGQLELTYRCNLHCIHCYCKGSANPGNELTTKAWKESLDELHREGCLWITLTGGEPLLRDDFMEIYQYARRKGFLISLFTNGTLFTREVLDGLRTSPPFSIEISLYGTTEEIHESVTQIPGSFRKTMGTIHQLLSEKMPLILKTVGLKQNRHEVLALKAMAEHLLGKDKFKFDSFITARLNGDRDPCRFRLSPEEILNIENSDPDMIAESQAVDRDADDLPRPPDHLYQCNAWWQRFFINPQGNLQFCHLSRKYSSDLRGKSFHEGFYVEFPRLLHEKFKMTVKCQTCLLRKDCYYCPPRALLETGSEEGPVEYYCQMAAARHDQNKKSRHPAACTDNGIRP
jgi:MoaA/NifB/PqqE/SkfB family radical SAM enzyme